MHPKPLIAAFGKIEWAVSQIDQLDGQIKAFVATKPYELVSNIEADIPSVQPIEVWRVKITKPIPDPFYPQVSAILGSLREPLDQVVSAVRRHRNKSESGCAFVFGKDRQEFEASLAEAEKVPADVRVAIAQAEPFYGGKGSILAALHYLKNPDKHRSDLVPILTSSALVLERLTIYKGFIRTIGPRSGKHAYMKWHKGMERPAGLSRPNRHGMPEIVPGVGMTLDPHVFRGGLDDGMEFATTNVGTKFETDFKPALDIAFGQVPGMDCEPVVSVLRQMRDLVQETLLAFEGRFFS